MRKFVLQYTNCSGRPTVNLITLLYYLLLNAYKTLNQTPVIVTMYCVTCRETISFIRLIE